MKFLPLLFASLLAASALAAPQRSAHTEAELVPEMSTIQQGDPFTVGLRLKMDPHWHTYYRNPGASGLPTEIDWELPEGFTADPIVWAVPEQFELMGATSFGYGGEVMHLVRIHPPETLAPGRTITLKAEVSWLECKETCIQGSVSLEATVQTVGNGQFPKFNEALKEQFLAARTGAGLVPVIKTYSVKHEVVEQALKVTLVPPPGGTLPESAFFYIDNEDLNPVGDSQRYENGVLSLDLSAADEPVKQLGGILTTKGGFSDGKAGVLVSINLDAGATPEPAPVPTPAPVPGPEPGPTPKPAPEAAFDIEAERAALQTMLSWGVEDKKSRGLPLILVFALVGGIILNVMPCVFPVLGIKIMGFVQQSGDDAAKIRTHGLVFGFGVLASMWVLVGALLAAQAAWGSQLQRPGFLIFMIALLFLFGLNLAGLFEIGTSLSAVGGDLQRKKGYSGSFFTGILTVLIATPCTGPFMGPALGYASTQPPAVAFLVFTMLGIGVALPYVVLSFIPALIQKLPKPGPWMETFKQFMAFPLLATVIWLLNVYAAAKGYTGMTWLLWGLLALGMAGWVYGKYIWTKKGLAYGLAIPLIALFGVAAVKSTADPEGGASKMAGADGTINKYGIAWTPYSPTRVVDLRKQGKTIFIDFTAKW